MENKNFNLNYIKCPECKNILDLSFVDKICPNPLCGFDFTGLDAYLNKSDDDLRKILLSDTDYENRSDSEYRLVVTAIKHNMGNYLAHFIECDWGAHYNSLYNDFILNFLDDLNVLKTVLKSEVIKEKDNVVVSQNGYKMYPELCEKLYDVHNQEVKDFLMKEYANYHVKWFRRLMETHRKRKNITK